MVHLLAGMIPRGVFRVPKTLLTPEQCASAVAALKEAEGIIAVKTPLADALATLSDDKAARGSKKAFIEATDSYRLALQGHLIKEPLRRIDLHQALMTAGFYVQAVEPTTVGDPRLSLLHYYSNEIRRDLQLSKSIHQYILEHHQSTKESEETLTSLLLMERKLFGTNRLHGKVSQAEQHLCIGVPLKEVKSEHELDRILAMPVIKEHGNFTKRIEDPDPDLKDPHRQRWKFAVVSCIPETTETFDARPFEKKDCEFELKVMKPKPPISFWGRVRQHILEAWVLFFTFWAMFFMVDEEILTFVGLIYTRWQQTKIMTEETEKAGGKKLYVTRNRGF